jgi:hypothetical protein
MIGVDVEDKDAHSTETVALVTRWASWRWAGTPGTCIIDPEVSVWALGVAVAATAAVLGTQYPLWTKGT